MSLRSIFGLLVGFGLSSCGEWKSQAKVRSPDGSAVASVDVLSRGASGSNQSRIILTDANGPDPKHGTEVLSSDGGAIVKLAWAGPTNLEVTLCGANDYEVKSRVLRHPPLKSDGAENAIFIDVKNLLPNRCG